MAIHGAYRIAARPSAIIAPHSGLDSDPPKPRNVSPELNNRQYDSVLHAAPTTSGSMFGRMTRSATYIRLAPAARAAITYG